MSTNSTNITLSKGDDQITIPMIENSYSAFFDQISVLQEGDVIVRADCKFCHHPARQEFELKWEQMRNINAIQRQMNKWAEENDGPVFSHQNIRTHLLNHYAKQERQMWKREYTERLLAVMNYKISKDQAFEFMSNGLQEQFIEIAADPTLDLAKQADLMVKIAKQVGDIALVQAKLRGDIQAVQMQNEKFIKVWTHLISSASDPMMQKALIESLDTFRQEVGEIVV